MPQSRRCYTRHAVACICQQTADLPFFLPSPAAGYLPLPTMVQGCNADTGLEHTLMWNIAGTCEEEGPGLLAITCHLQRLTSLLACVCMLSTIHFTPGCAHPVQPPRPTASTSLRCACPAT